ncbi:hypothetical protein [uncultured Shewanella sp.]|nr:hypothetical protein [uncultured Shewanella sp.]
MIDKTTPFAIDGFVVDIFYLLASSIVGMIVFFDAWAWLVNILVKI